MRKLQVSILALAAVMVMGSVQAQADEYDTAYGNLHGTIGSDFSGGGGATFAPYINLGLKYASDGPAGTTGFQFDADGYYNNMALNSPNNASVSGYSAEIDTAAHITQLIDQDKKIGAFVGYASQTWSATDTSASSLSAGGQAALKSFTLNIGTIGAGVEGLVAMSDQTSLQARIAVIDTSFVGLTYDKGGGSISNSRFDLGMMPLGYMASVGANHQFNQNISARADLNYATFMSNISIINATLGAQYTMDSSPLSLGVAGSFVNLGSAGVWTNEYGVAGKLTYSFGAPSRGAQGKLFRSGILGFLY